MSQGPWKSIWMRPKTAFEELKSYAPTYMWWFFATIVGINSILPLIVNPRVTGLTGASYLVFAALALIFAPILTWLLFHLGSYILWRVSGLFKGGATLDDARRVFVWSQAPMLIYILFVAGVTVMGAVTGQPIISQTTPAYALGFTGIGAFILLAWSIWIFFTGIMQMNQCKGGKAFGIWIVTQFLYTVALGIAQTILIRLFSGAVGFFS